MPKILFTSSFDKMPKALLLCLALLTATEFAVGMNVTRLKTLSDSVIDYKSYLLNEGNSKKYDAVVFGDSRIMGLNAQYISEHVSGNLGRKFELYNFSIPNNGISTYYLLLKKYLKNQPAPRYILFSSAPVNLSGDWSVEKSVGRSEILHRMSQLYSLNELLEVLPVRMWVTALTVKAERLSFLLLYRGAVKKALVDPKNNFNDVMTGAIRSCIRYNGGNIFSRNKAVTEQEIKSNKYYEWNLEVDENVDYWYQRFFSLAQEHGIKVLLINAPVYHDILQNGELNGTNQTYRQVVQRWQLKFDNIEVLGPLQQSYTIENFSDWQHVNVSGTRQFTFSVTDYLIDYLKAHP
jgi:hypothetical protein